VKPIVIDNFFEDPLKERNNALKALYNPLEHDGYPYHGFSFTNDPGTTSRILEALRITSTPTKVTCSYRRYLPEDSQATYIHNDSNIGTFSAICFLTEDKDSTGSGLAFWKHKVTGWTGQPTLEEFLPTGLKDEPKTWHNMVSEGKDESKWDMIDFVPMKFNRMVIFPSHKYHSRFPQDTIGNTIDTSRLIKVFFIKL